jgi:hypothetical protein
VSKKGSNPQPPLGAEKPPPPPPPPAKRIINENVIFVLKREKDKT